MAEQDTVAATAATTKPAAIITAPAPEPVNSYVQMLKSLFHFKAEKIKDENNKVLETRPKHPSVEIYLPVPKAERLVEFLQDTVKYAKEVELLTVAVADVIYRAARQQINELRESGKTEITPASINYDRMDWTVIANMPKSERGTYVPTEDDMKDFCEQYLAFMPTILERTPEKVQNHLVCFNTFFRRQRNSPEMLTFFSNCLTLYKASVEPSVVEDTLEVVEYLENRIARMLKAEEKISMDDL